LDLYSRYYENIERKENRRLRRILLKTNAGKSLLPNIRQYSTHWEELYEDELLLFWPWSLGILSTWDLEQFRKIFLSKMSMASWVCKKMYLYLGFVIQFVIQFVINFVISNPFLLGTLSKENRPSLCTNPAWSLVFTVVNWH
jgi:hypothetical protein